MTGRFQRFLLGFAIMAIVSLSAMLCVASEVTEDPWPEKNDTESLQRGARLFVNFCLGCHSMRSVRMASLDRLRLTDEQIQENLLLNGVDLAETMTIAFRPEDAKKAFGALPPDLSLIVKAKTTRSIRGSDWIYNFLRQFYRDESRPWGWNNQIAASTAMPHVLSGLQGTKALAEAGKNFSLATVKAGQMTPLEYDAAVADLVAFLSYAADPVQSDRERVGLICLAFLLILFMLVYAVKIEFWRRLS